MAKGDFWKNLLSAGASGISPLGAITTGVNTATNVAKGIFGAVQAAKGRKELNNLLANPVTYKRPEEYFADLQAQQQRAGMTKMPGQGYAEQNIGQAYSQAIGNLVKGAISSNVYQRGVGDLYQKTLNAYQDLAQQSAQWQDQQQANLSAARQRGMQFSDQEWSQNKLFPWEMKANMATDKIQAGQQNMSSGFGGALGGLSDFAGTSYYNAMLKKLMGNG